MPLSPGFRPLSAGPPLGHSPIYAYVGLATPVPQMFPLESADPGDLPNRVREIISICPVAVNQGHSGWVPASEFVTRQCVNRWTGLWRLRHASQLPTGSSGNPLTEVARRRVALPRRKAHPPPDSPSPSADRGGRWRPPVSGCSPREAARVARSVPWGTAPIGTAVVSMKGSTSTSRCRRTLTFWINRRVCHRCSRPIVRTAPARNAV